MAVSRRHSWFITASTVVAVFLLVGAALFIVLSHEYVNTYVHTEWPKKVRTPGVLIIQNHIVLKSALKEV